MTDKREALIVHITNTVQQFQVSEKQKLRSLNQLGKLLGILNGRIDFIQFNLIFKTLIRCLVTHKESTEFVSIIMCCAEKLSTGLSLNSLTLQVFNMIEKEAPKDSLISLASTLTLLKCLYSNPKSFAETPSKLFEDVVKGFMKIENLLIDQPLMVAAPVWFVLNKTIQRMPTLPEPKPELCENSLRLIITMKASLTSISIISDADVHNLIFQLAQCYSLMPEDFVQKAVAEFIRKLVSSKSYELWDSHSIERQQFTALMSLCSQILFRFLDEIAHIIASCLHSDKDLETRFETLEMLHKIVIQSASSIKHPLGEYYLSSVILSSLVWKVGKSNNKVRKAGILCFISMIKKSFLSRDDILNQLSNLMPTIKSCLCDDWTHDLRFATLELMCVLLELLLNTIPTEILQEIYLSILDRLDDAQDEIRIKAVEVLESIFCCSNCAFSSGIKDYILKILFAHFDDSNEQLQYRVYLALKAFATKIDAGLVLNKSKFSALRFRNPHLCRVLIEEIEKN